ncbi:MAG: metal dependent phosphohydrolase [Deltaproteobacteria bacterium]|nr:metal dependent phosphohydrolase [Deltaproteobacteria bacterium]
MVEADSREIREFVQGIYRSRTIPTLLGKILEVTRDDNSSPQDLFRLISHDQVLAERVIRLANSAIFGHSGKVKGLQHAVMFLGYERIRSIALAMGVMEVFPGRNSYDVQNLWIHGYEVAYIAAAVSDTICMATPDEAFLSGLLHDIGRLIFFEKDRERYYRIGTEDDMLEREVELFGCTHAEAGGWYAENVGIPEELVHAIRYHHQPSKSKDSRLCVSIVSIAEVFARTLRPRVIDDGIWSPEHDAILLELSIGEDTKHQIRHKLQGLEYDIKGFFQ